ncbi:MAG: glycosyltransferase family 2 protein, partial [Lachnospiraceae bacterium]|nr:glycosyltransferase family 2 protein [Lachnospiraceae bacterium]
MGLGNMKTAVLLATYNGRRFLEAQLDSLMGQTVADFVIAIHDDGSTDGTVSLLEKYRSKFPERIEVVEGPSCGGAKENFWFLLSQVEADVYFFCDQDDVWIPEKIERQRQVLLSFDNNTPALVFSDMKVCDESLGTMAESFWDYIGRDAGELRLPRVLIDNPAAGTSMAFNRALRDVAVGTEFDLSGVEMHDGFLLALALGCGTVEKMDEALVLYRQHGENACGAAQSESRLQRIFRNAKEVLSGRFLEKKRAFLRLSRAAAGELSKAKQ